MQGESALELRLLVVGLALLACQATEHSAATPADTVSKEGHLGAATSKSVTSPVGGTKAPAADAPPQRGEPTFFDKNGYRHTYTPRASRDALGLVVLGTTDTPSKARQLARKAQAALGLHFSDLPYDPAYGFVYPASSCVEQPYPCGPGTRGGRSPGAHAHISIERGGYERWRAGEFVVIAAHGPPGDTLLQETLTKAKATFPEAYVETTRRVWTEYTYRKLRPDELPDELSATADQPRSHVESEQWPRCAAKRRVVRDRFMTPWGITLRDIENTVLGEHRTPLTWRHDDEISYGVEGTSTTLRVEITRRGDAKFVASEPAGEFAYGCSAELIIPVHVKATTEDGVFAMEGDSRVRVSSQHSIALRLYAAQTGTLQIRATKDTGTIVDSLGIALGFRRTRTMVGAIGGGYMCSGEGCMHIPYAYACFPETPPFRLNEFMFDACGG